MALKPGLHVRQAQKLALTPGLRQSLSVLAMSSAELEQHVQSELDNNPVLSADFSHPSGPAPDLRHALENTASPQTVGHVLHEQIAVMSAPDTIRNIASFLAQDLTAEGYLSDSIDDIAAHLRVEKERVAEAVNLLQTCEPVGIGARDLRECLELQLTELGEPAQVRALLLENLTLFAQRDWATLARISGLEAQELNRLFSVLHTLNPRPAQTLVPDLAPILTPDIEVSTRPDGTCSVAFIGSTLPSLFLDQGLVEKMVSASTEAKYYVKENVTRATDLIKAIEARSKTVLRVAARIVSHQHQFFASGPAFLYPLTQREIAGMLDVHPSTVNRAIAGKSLECAFGVFPLKFFFTNSVNSVSTEERFSAHVVQRKIKDIIDEESSDDILSDERISALLHQSGVDMARRTVAKYRQCLNIPSSSQRRRSKKFL